MKTVEYGKIVETVKQLCIDSCYLLPEDVYKALKRALTAETNATAKNILSKLIENADIARNERIPICQDTGLAVVFIEHGSLCNIAAPACEPEATLFDAVNEGVRLGYEEGLLRKSVVAEPLDKRQNTKTNTPAVIHYQMVRGDKLKITIMSKGGGCENKSAFKMFNPTASKDDICKWIVGVVKEAGANACPPFVVGVGIGGDFEQCCLNSKKTLLREIDSANPEPFYAQIESQLLEDINKCGFGPQGFGGDTSALAVFVETSPCHIASLPVAVNIECHAHRHKQAVL